MEATLEEVIEKERQEAYQRGMNAGRKSGYQEALDEAASFFSIVQRLSDKLLEQREQLLTQLKPQIIELSLKVAEKIIRQELANPEKFVKLIDSLLATALLSLGGEKLFVYLAPDDLLMLEGHLANIVVDKREVGGLRFLPDPAVLRGDVRIESAHGLLNASIARELEDIQSKVL